MSAPSTPRKEARLSIDSSGSSDVSMLFTPEQKSPKVEARARAKKMFDTSTSQKAARFETPGSVRYGCLEDPDDKDLKDLKEYMDKSNQAMMDHVSNQHGNTQNHVSNEHDETRKVLSDEAARSLNKVLDQYLSKRPGAAQFAFLENPNDEDLVIEEYPSKRDQAKMDHNSKQHGYTQNRVSKEHMNDRITNFKQEVLESCKKAILEGHLINDSLGGAFISVGTVASDSLEAKEQFELLRVAFAALKDIKSSKQRYLYQEINRKKRELDNLKREHNQLVSDIENDKWLEDVFSGYTKDQEAGTLLKRETGWSYRGKKRPRWTAGAPKPRHRRCGLCSKTLTNEGLQKKSTPTRCKGRSI